MTDSSDLGCAVRLDGSLKDASEIEWHNDPDNELPITPVSSTSSTPATIHPFFTGHPAPAVMAAGSRRSGRAVRPSARIVDPDNAMNKPAGSSSAPKSSVASYKRNAPPSPPSRRITRKIDTDSSDEYDANDGDTSIAELSSQCLESSDAEQTENGTDKYDTLQSMADTDHQVCHGTTLPLNIVIC